MSYIDLDNTLAGWPYDPEQISVRKIVGVDGQTKLQMRVELGILQLHPDDCPDGAKPFGHDSLLLFHQKRLANHEERNGTPLGFTVSPQQCQDLRAEASIYYRRFVCHFVLEEYDKVFRDTSHNLAVFDFCRDYGLEADDREALEAYRPYVLMMDARARAHHALAANEPASALAHVNRGMMAIAARYEEQGHPEAAERSDELKILRELGRELNRKVPKDSILVTRKALRDAIEQERFEEAARLRDELDKLYPNNKMPPNAA